jgi:hypothetical protein
MREIAHSWHNARCPHGTSALDRGASKHTQHDLSSPTAEAGPSKLTRRSVRTFCADPPRTIVPTYVPNVRNVHDVHLNVACHDLGAHEHNCLPLQIRTISKWKNNPTIADCKFPRLALNHVVQIAFRQDVTVCTHRSMMVRAVYIHKYYRMQHNIYGTLACHAKGATHKLGSHKHAIHKANIFV